MRQGRAPSFDAQLWLLLLPYLLGSLALVVLPALGVVALSLMDGRLGAVPHWVGLRNFARLFASPLVHLSLWNTLLLALVAVPLRVVGALGLALLLRPAGRRFALYRTAIYLPTVLPEVPYALLWLWLLHPLYGPLNGLLALVGLPTPAWLAEPAGARLAIGLLLAFQVGEGVVVLLAALRTVPAPIHEAALVDGASAWQRFRYVILPLLAPWLLLLTFRDLLVSIQNSFTPSFVMTYGGPSYGTMFLPLLIYELGFDFLELGMAAALLVLWFLALAILVGAVWGAARRVGLYDG